MTDRHFLETFTAAVPATEDEQILGRHVLVEMHGCSPVALNDLEALQTSMLDAAALLGTTVLNVYGHRFTPQGATVIVAIAESHLTVHTWPEHGYAAIDFFLCGGLDRPVEAAVDLLADLLQPEHCSVRPIDRGLLAEPALAGSR